MRRSGSPAAYSACPPYLSSGIASKCLMSITLQKRVMLEREKVSEALTFSLSNPWFKAKEVFDKPWLMIG
jgi:hypothetical protein